MKKRIISVMFALCLALTLLPMTAWAADTEERKFPAEGQWGDNLTWSYDEESKTLTIGGTGPMGKRPDLVNEIRLDDTKDITTVIIGEGITSVGPGAFKGFGSLKNITLPESLVVIGESAFEYSGLEHITIPEGVVAFRENAFKGCSLLKTIDIPDTVTAIFSGAFEDCRSLEAITIPDSVKYIGSRAFFNAKKLKNIVIPKDILEVSVACFSGCAALEGVTLPDGLLKISNRAFMDCTALTDIKIPEKVATIGAIAFYGCESLTSVTIPESTRAVGRELFGNCTKLTKVEFLNPNCTFFLEDSADKIFANCKSLTEVTLPGTIRTLYEGTFSGCESLTTVNIPASVAGIAEGCFKDCSSLTTINYAGAQWQWDQGVGSTTKTFWERSGLDPAKVKINYAPGGQCEEAGGFYWSYAPESNVLSIEYKYAAGKDAILRRPAGGASMGWEDHLKNDPLICISYARQIDADVFAANTIVHMKSRHEEFTPPAGLSVHELRKEAKNSPKCTTPGSTEGYRCSVSGCTAAKALEPQTLPQLQHSPAFVSHIPSCSEDGTAGSFSMGCTNYEYFNTVTDSKRCPAELMTPVSFTFTDCHTPYEFVSQEIKLEPTCTERGYALVTRKCENCGETTAVEEVLRSNGHKWDEEKHEEIVKPATCTSSGTKQYYNYCTVEGCDGKRRIGIEPEEIPALGHTWGEWKTLGTGYRKRTCSVCSRVEDENTVQIVLGYGTSSDPRSDVLTVDDSGIITSLPEAPIRPGYRFDGWFNAAADGTKLEVGKKLPSNSTVLYACWTEETAPPETKHTVTFNLNYSGAPAGTTDSVTDGEQVSSPTDPGRDGFLFKGWYTDADGTKAWNFDTAVTESITLYAKWEKDGGGNDEPGNKTYKITFNANGGTGGSTMTTLQGGMLSSTPSDPTRAGYTFDGWYTAADASGQKVTVSAATFEKDTTLYAHWTRNSTTPADKTYTITFNANGGSVSPAYAVTNADGKVTPPTPTRAGYTFAGWYTALSGGTQVTTATVFSADTTVYARWDQSSGTSSAAYYQIYTPGVTYGGSFSVSHTFAAPGTLVTVTSSPWSNFELSQLSAIRADTGWELYLTRYYNNQYTFLMPNSDVQLIGSYAQTYTGTVSPSYPATNTSSGNSGYTDASASTKPVNWYYSGGHIYHVTDGLVPAGTALTRDMLVSVLYNMDSTSSGRPTIWAAENNIVPDIYQSGLWGPDKSISREQAAMILFCYAQHKGYATNQRSSLTGYTDYGQMRSIARPAMAWSRAVGLMTATSARTLSPQAILTCGEANAILSRFVSSVATGW